MRTHGAKAERRRAFVQAFVELMVLHARFPEMRKVMKQREDMLLMILQPVWFIK